MEATFRSMFYWQKITVHTGNLFVSVGCFVTCSVLLQRQLHKIGFGHVSLISSFFYI